MLRVVLFAYGTDYLLFTFNLTVLFGGGNLISPLASDFCSDLYRDRLCSVLCL